MVIGSTHLTNFRVVFSLLLVTCYYVRLGLVRLALG